jgi:MFS family permease
MATSERCPAGIGSAARRASAALSLDLPVSARVRRDFRFDCLNTILYGPLNGVAVGYLYVVARTIGVSPLGISVLVAMSAAGATLSLPVSLVLRRGGRAFMLTAWILGRGCLLLLLLHSTPALYLVLAALFLVSCQVPTPFYAQAMQTIYPQAYRGRLMGLTRVANGAATTASSVVMAWLLGSGLVTFQEVFAVAGALGVISVGVFSRMTPARVHPRQSFRHTLSMLRRNRLFAGYQVGVMVMGAGYVMATTLYPLVMVDKLHAGYGSVGVLSVITSLGYMGSFVAWGWVLDHKGPLVTMLLAGLCVATLPAGMLLAPSVYWLTPFALITGMVTAGFELGPYGAAINYALATPQDVPLYMALHSYLSGLRGLVMPFVATLILAGHHYGFSLGTALALSALGTLMLWHLARQEPQIECGGSP